VDAGELGVEIDRGCYEYPAPVFAQTRFIEGKML
jgi:hypothetical protein